MPNETQEAVNWALKQKGVFGESGIDNHLLVDTVRQYFNSYNIQCEPMCFDDLIPYLQLTE